jgi:uncharacterized protein
MMKQGSVAVAMPDQLRFFAGSNRAREIHWRAWGQAALDEAAASGRPVLLNLTSVWCAWCQRMDETTYSDSDVIRIINEELVPLRVDADRYPHVQDRYIAGGWPTTAFLTPTGEVLWSGTYIDPDTFREVAAGVLGAWRDRREELEAEIGRRRSALDASRGRSAGLGLVRREPADDVLTAIRDAFDPRNGGFGEAPKFPQPDAIELLYAQAAADPACATMADQTLDGMLAGELWDGVDGGFFRYATAADWTEPRHEKLLDVNAALLGAYTLGAAIRGRDDWRGIAERTVAWVEDTLALDDGLWAGSQFADAAYFAAGAATRSTLRPPPLDATVYAAANARWISVLAGAGARLGHDAWVTRAEHGLAALLAAMRSSGGGMYHFRENGGEPHLDFLLADAVATARAALDVAQATGTAAWLQEARRLACHMETAFWSEDGAFWDRARSDHDVGALRYRDRPLGLNAAAARVLLDLAHVTGERRWRGLAERTLARLGPHAGRYGADGALFALATDEFFEQPPCIMIAVPDQADPAAPAAVALRRAAFSLPVPLLRVWTVPGGHAVGPHRFPATAAPAAFVWTRRGCSSPIEAPERLADATGAHL